MLKLEWSQYIFEEAGSSACTAIAMSVIVTLLKHIRHSSLQSLAQEELQNALVEGVVKYNEINSFGDAKHFSAEELLPIFSDSLAVLGNTQGVTTDASAFRQLFKNVFSREKVGNYVGIVITKPPETVCILVPTESATSSSDSALQYALFDSHARPQYGYSGAYLLLSYAEEEIIQHLQMLFPGLTEGEGSVYEMMYNMFDATTFSLK